MARLFDDYPNAGSWGIHNQIGGSRYIAYNNGQSIDTIEFGADGGGIINVPNNFTNLTPMPASLGGLSAGTTFDNEPVTGVLDRLLYPYQSPVFSSFNLNINSPLEIGAYTHASNTQVNFSWSTTNSSNILPNTISITDLTNNLSLLQNSNNDGSQDINMQPIFKTSPSSHQWRIRLMDARGNNIDKTFTLNWYHRMYYGVSDITLLSQGNIKSFGSFLASNPNRDYVFGPTNYKYICIPTSMTQPTTFTDKLNGINVAMEAPYSVTVTNANSMNIPYSVYRTTNKLGSSITIVVSP